MIRVTSITFVAFDDKLLKGESGIVMDIINTNVSTVVNHVESSMHLIKIRKHELHEKTEKKMIASKKCKTNEKLNL